MAVEGGFYGSGSGPVWLDDLECSGREAEISDCVHRGWSSHNCMHSEDAGVRCFTDDMTTPPTTSTTTTGIGYILLYKDIVSTRAFGERIPLPRHVIITKWEILDFLVFLYPDCDPNQSQNLLESKSRTHLLIFFHEDPTSSICLILLTNKQTNR